MTPPSRFGMWEGSVLTRRCPRTSARKGHSMKTMTMSGASLTASTARSYFLPLITG